MAVNQSETIPVTSLRAPEAAAHVHWHSHPREWCFSQLRDAAFATLDAQVSALEKGGMLREARASNVQFTFAGPHIDTVNMVVPYRGGAWPAYTQFCRHFLTPFQLMHRKPGDYPRYEWEHTDGLGLAEASARLGWKSCLNLDALLHVHLPSRIHALQPGAFFLQSGEGWTRNTLSDLLGSLFQAIERIPPPRVRAYSCSEFDLRRLMQIDTLLHELRGSPPGELWVDLGASPLVDPARPRLVFLTDPEAAERCYQAREAGRARSALPFLAGATDLETAVETRLRRRAGVVTVCGTLPALFRDLGQSFKRVCTLLAGMAKRAVVEWIPPDDPAARTEFPGRVPDDYRFDLLWEAIQPYYEIVQIEKLPSCSRRLFLLEPR